MWKEDAKCKTKAASLTPKSQSKQKGFVFFLEALQICPAKEDPL